MKNRQKKLSFSLTVSPSSLSFSHQHITQTHTYIKSLSHKHNAHSFYLKPTKSGWGERNRRLGEDPGPFDYTRCYFNVISLFRKSVKCFILIELLFPDKWVGPVALQSVSAEHFISVLIIKSELLKPVKLCYKELCFNKNLVFNEQIVFVTNVLTIIVNAFLV